MRRSAWISNLLVFAFFLLLSLVFFWRVVAGGYLLPFDSLLQYQPWQSHAQELLPGYQHPQNQLVSDLILENLPWKQFAVDSVRHGQLPLWNPNLFGGVPFLAAGQSSALYPLSALFYVLPVGRAFGYFAILHFALAAFFTYVFVRTIRLGRGAAVFAGVTFAFSLFMVASVVFPMVIGAAIWLPLLLAVVERLVQRFEPGWQSGTGRARAFFTSPLVLVPAGAMVLGVQFLAGHIEISYYILLTVAVYGAVRLAMLAWQCRAWRPVGSALAAMTALAVLGFGLAAVLLVPFYELAAFNFRQGSVSYDQVVAWAFPRRQVLSFLMPDVFGNPAHHSYFDVLRWQSLPFLKDAAGKSIDFPFWGSKNYVEAAAYIGVLPLVLGLAALIWHRGRYVWTFLALAVASLLFAFGTPLYGLLFYTLPGFKQLHSAFRWVFPYTVAASLLAGLGFAGIERLVNGRDGRKGAQRQVAVLGAAVAAVGILLLAGAALSRLVSQRSLDVATRLLRARADLQGAFADGAVLYSYELRNVVLFAAFLTLSGLLLFLVARRLLSVRLFAPLAVLIVVTDLFIVGIGFNPTNRTNVADYVPQSVQAVKQDTGLYRITTYGQDKTLQANSGMYYGLQDVRGYDSIIPKSYVTYMEKIQPQGDLLYNRIAPIYDEANLDSPLLDLLNVKYVFTAQEIHRPGYTLVHTSDLKVYRNDDVLPRAFVAPRVRVLPDEDAVLAAMTGGGFDPRGEVLISVQSAQAAGLNGAIAPIASSAASVTQYGANSVTVDVRGVNGGMLFLGDSYFPGWRARVDGVDRPLARADYQFRAVQLRPGDRSVVFEYAPFSFKLGLYVSLLALVICVACVGFGGWRAFYREHESDHPARVVAKNTFTPLVTTLLNRAIDFGFAIFYTRLLGPEGVGRYTFAVAVWWYFSTLTDFGLGTLLTREVAKDRSRAGEMAGNTIAVRTLLTLVSFLPVAGIMALYGGAGKMSFETGVAIALLVLGLLPSNVSGVLTALFNAYEKMEVPSGVTVVSTLSKVVLGLTVLLLGWGIVGLAAVSIVVNLLTLAVLYRLARQMLLRPRWHLERRFSWTMLVTAFPLLLNSFLVSLFFKIDFLMLPAMRGERVLGLYGTAYKFIDALLVIPPVFTFAIFPLLARYAVSSTERLIHTYGTAVKLLLVVALPICVGTTLLGHEIISLSFGQQFLPDSAIALQILIWFLPLSYANGVTQYVFIAMNKQRLITINFALVTAFNVAVNFVLIPRYSYVGASVTTVLSEVVLFALYLAMMRSHLPVAPLLRVMVRPAAAGLLMGALVWWLRFINPWIDGLLSLVLYVVAIVVLGTFSREEWLLLRKILRRERAVEAA